MGDLGAELLPAEARVLTHCNAGALATAGYGTALGVIRSAVALGKVKARVRRRDAALAPGGAPHRLGAAAGRHPHHPHRRQHGGPPDGPRRDQRGRGRARTASPRTATWPTRSAPTPWPSWPRSTASRSTWRRPSRPSTSRPPPAPASRSRSAPAEEVTHVAGRRVAPEGVARPQPRLRRHAAPLRHGHRLREGRRAAAVRGEPARAGRRPRGPARGRVSRGVALVLGIETSCDETAAAVVEDGRRDPLERRVEPGRGPRPLRRGRAGARLAPPPREHRAR